MTALTHRHRAQQLLVRKNTISQVRSLWPALKYADLDGTYAKLAGPVAKVVEANRRTSAGLSAGYVREFRRSQGVAGQAQTVVAARLNSEQFNASLRTTSLAAVKSATARAVPESEAMANALAFAANAMARLALDAGRDTILQTLQADPKGVGWQRVLGGPGCDFCQQQAGRGAIYFNDETAGFEPHDKCGCTPEPVYRA